MNVAIYARVSTEEQAVDGFSIQGQVNVLSDYCNMRNYKIVNIYKDEGISGKSIKDRPALNQLLHDSKLGLFNMVIVWKISRLSRKQLDFLTIIDEFEKNNISFNSYSENIDATNPAGKAMLQMMSSFAELERNTIIENVKMGMKQRANEGEWNGGIILGYKSENKSLVIVNNEAEIVRYIFRLYLDGMGYKAIANRLNHEGYKTKKSRGFSITSIRTILTNPTYAGYIRYNQVEDWNKKRRKGKNKDFIMVEGKHEAIISREIWNKAQKILIEKSHKPTKTFTGSYPLTTLLRCPVCGQGMIGHRSKNSTGEYIRYYQCGNFHYKGSAVCRSNMVRADYAEEYVFSKLEKLTSEPSLLKQIIDKVNEKITKYKQPLNNQLKGAEENLKKVNVNINKYLSLFEDNKIPPDIITDKLNSLDNEKRLLENRIKEIKTELDKPNIEEVSYEQVHSILLNFSKVFEGISPDKQKDILHTIINRITINPSDKISERCIKSIELFFDTLHSTDFVLTYGKLLQRLFYMICKFAQAELL